MNWFKKKKACTHCRDNKTRRDFEGQPTCVECKMKILIRREEKRTCPVDGARLIKTHQNEIIIDRCPKCEGIWLDAGELEAIRQAAKEEGMTTGVATGVAIGTVI